ncbi:hypothetical protein [Natronoarchaeum rubrum]|uniref:hypothetical protein n=1 Tax=Natronoarchaeum rubrum TaxID=755311 RepID=UPI002111A19D|nr:hypothetical protein [Natronoarchaeum rubrum]HMB49533.1 hypothetical protein [Natronoarchaeum rubrum]
MERNPVENNFVTRFLLGLAVVFGMVLGGGAVGWSLSTAGLPFGVWIGTAVGALAVFIAFAVWYGRYDASFSAA